MAAAGLAERIMKMCLFPWLLHDIFPSRLARRDRSGNIIARRARSV